MRSLILTPFLLLLLATSTAFADSPQQQSAKSFAARFYRTYLKLSIRGLPASKEYKALSPLLSPSLRQLFEAAKRKQERFIKENASDLKPPWVDGDLFTSLWEGAHSFQLGSPRLRGNSAEVPVHLAHRVGRSASRWSDRLVLIQTKDGWRVWNIFLDGKWPFKNGYSLRDILKAE
jgi:hypothetical protein